MAQSACVNRLQKEYRNLLKDPVENIKAHPAPNNLLDWHYVITGAAGSEYEGGYYHGRVSFPKDYPYKPPSIIMYTPNGRFAVEQKLCLSISDFHPESWNPLWSVGTILIGLQSFMYDTVQTTGSISTTKAEKQRLAGASLDHNVRSPIFRKLFPEYVEEQKQRHKERAEAAKQQAEHVPPGKEREGAKGHLKGTGRQQGGASLTSMLGSLALLAMLAAIMLIPMLAG